MTGLPINMASARPRPKPSERCSETKQSHPFTSDLISRSSITRSIQRMRGSPVRFPFLNASYASEHSDIPFVLMTRPTESSELEKACSNARTTAMGFFLLTNERKSKKKRKRNRSSGRPRASRLANSVCRCSTASGIQRTGQSVLSAIACWMKREGAQISSKPSNAGSHASGRRLNSHAQYPML